MGCALTLKQQAVANKLHGTEVDVNVIKTKDDGCDHVQFEIIQKAKVGQLTDGTQPTDDEWKPIDSRLSAIENKISPLTFCKAFPFHLVFDKNLVVRQVFKHLFFYLKNITKHENVLQTVIASNYWELT